MFVDFAPFEFLVTDRSPVAYCDDARFLTELAAVQTDPLCVKLMPHQWAATAFLNSRMGAILADDMGLGKTHASSAAVVRKRLFPCLVVCQSGMREEWMKTLLVYNPSLTFDLPGDETAVGGKDVTIISYARMAEQFSHLRKLHFLSTIIDEAHHLKNEKDLGKREREQILRAVDDGHAMTLHRTQIAFELCRQIKHVFCLTGTPILSRPRELFNLLRLTRHPWASASRNAASGAGDSYP